MTGTCDPFNMFSFSVTMHIEFLSSFRFIKVVRIRILVEEEGGHRVYMGIRYHVDQLNFALFTPALH